MGQLDVRPKGGAGPPGRGLAGELLDYTQVNRITSIEKVRPGDQGEGQVEEQLEGYIVDKAEGQEVDHVDCRWNLRMSDRRLSRRSGIILDSR